MAERVGEASSIAKLVIILGVVFLLIGLIFPGQDAAWNGFRTSLSTGPSLPKFDNPFDNGQVFSFAFGFDSGGAGYENIIKTHGTANNCASFGHPYWRCITDPNGADGNASYIEVTDDNAGPSEFLSLNTTGWPSAGTVRSGVLTMQCRSNETLAVHINVVLNEYIPITGGSGNTYLESINENVYCKAGLAFTTTTVHLHPALATYNLNANAHGPNLQMFILAPHGTSFHVSTLTFTAVIGDTTGCAGGDFFSNIGCQLQEFFAFLSNVGHFVVNGISFVLAFIFAIVSFILSVVANLFLGLFTTLTWFLAIPGAPPVVQLLMGSIFVGVIAYILYVILKIFTGMIGGINPV